MFVWDAYASYNTSPGTPLGVSGDLNDPGQRSMMKAGEGVAKHLVISITILNIDIIIIFIRQPFSHLLIERHAKTYQGGG